MTAGVSPITDADIAVAAEFLRTNHNNRTPWTASCSAPWEDKAPNHGFMLRDGERVVGVLLALYSERLVAGRLERFCNMGSWCVLPEYRGESMSLLNAMLAQEGFHFTSLSPKEGPREILAWLKFRYLDTSAALIPNLPWPTFRCGTRISADPDVIERSLVGSGLALYRDHAQALAARHLVLTRGQESGHVMYREFRYMGALGYAMILHVSNLDLFHRSLIPLTRHLLVRRGLVATLAELRTIEHRPLLSFSLNNRPKMYSSPSLEPRQIDYLYSELACVPW